VVTLFYVLLELLLIFHFCTIQNNFDNAFGLKISDSTESMKQWQQEARLHKAINALTLFNIAYIINLNFDLTWHKLYVF
jgi:hypothetical protein